MDGAVELLERSASTSPSSGAGLPARTVRRRAPAVVIAIAIANDPDLIICDEPHHRPGRHRSGPDPRGAQDRPGRHERRRADSSPTAWGGRRVHRPALVVAAGRAVEAASVHDPTPIARMPHTAGLFRVGPPPRCAAVSGWCRSRGAPPSLVSLLPAARSPRCPLAIDDCLAAEPALVAVDGNPGPHRGMHPHRPGCRPQCPPTSTAWPSNGRQRRRRRRAGRMVRVRDLSRTYHSPGCGVPPPDRRGPRRRQRELRGPAGP